MADILETIPPLDETQRLHAKNAAREAIMEYAGRKPTREQYQHETISDYPRWLTALVMLGLLVVFTGSFAMSIFRLFTAGRDYFLVGIEIGWQGAVAGAAIFLMAEFTVLVSTMTRKVYFAGAGRIMLVPIAIGVTLAIGGNIVVAQPHDAFGWLETLSPPVVVLFMSIIGENIILKALQARQANERTYQGALADWKAKTAEPETHPDFIQVYANTLKSALKSANHGKWRGSAETLRNLSLNDWRSLVSRELQSENWFTPTIANPVPVVPEVASAPRPLSFNELPNGHRNGHSSQA